MRPLLFALLLLLPGPANCQDAGSKWAAGFNPFSLAEPGTAVSGLITYQISPRFSAAVEAGYIFRNAYLLPKKWTSLQGYRFMVQPRLYSRFANHFFALEFRVKGLHFNSVNNFIDPALPDTLFNFPIREKHFLIGGALLYGKNFRLSANNKWFMECSLGLGARHRFIHYKGLPSAGYSHYVYAKDRYALAPDYESNDVGTIYVPAGIKLLWRW